MRKWVVIAGITVLLIIVVTAAGEVTARLLKVHVQGIDRHLFVHLDNIAYFHAPRAEGLRAFGRPIYTDERGFRIPPGGSGRRGSGILFLGDSVTFGIGVPEAESFVGRLRTVWPSHTLYNAGIIGFNTPSELQTAQHFVPILQPLDAIVVMFALNDLEDISSSDIRRAIQGMPDPEAAADTRARVNVFLRQHSAFFVLLKNFWRDIPRDYFLLDTQLYQYPEIVGSVASFLTDINALGKQYGAKTYIVLLPYAYQLRTHDPSLRFPQEILSKALRDRNLTPIDLYPCLAKVPDSTSLFLYRDHMHFSSEGHGRAAECLRQLLPVE